METARLILNAGNTKHQRQSNLVQTPALEVLNDCNGLLVRFLTFYAAHFHFLLDYNLRD